MKTLTRITERTKDIVAYVSRGAFSLTHNSFTLVGLALVFALLGLFSQPELRQNTEARLMGWLQARQTEATGIEVIAEAGERATATNPKDLPKQQAALAYWLSKKYRVAPEPLAALVAEAFEVSKHVRLEPTLILAIMAIESGFNPFAQSPVGAQGLMQVMTAVHTDKFAHFGGTLAAFDPVSNLRVGVKVLQECIARAGSLEAGLRQYVGASGSDDGGYTSKVLAESERLQQVARGLSVPTSTPATPVPVAAPKPVSPPALESSEEKLAALTSWR
jgi:hypothetical protein